ncbi:unnamed protein product [Parajaminaea phylloscopi]
MAGQPGAAAPILSYSESKILFVSDNLGSSITRVSAILSVSVSSYALYASTIRLVHARTLLRRQRPYPPEQSWVVALLQLYDQDAPANTLPTKVLAIELASTAIPFLLVVTLMASTSGAAALSGGLTAASAYFLHRSRQLQRLSQVSRKPRKESIEGTSSDEDTAAVYNQTAYLGSDHASGIRRRTTAGRSSSSSQRTRSRRRRTWESDEEEQELEEIERLESERSRPPIDSATQTFRVSVESAADQAHTQAHPAETWKDPHQRAAGVPEIGPRETSSPKCYGRGHKSHAASPLQASSQRARRHHDSFLTVYRAHMMILTIICILAVDFPAFPRSLGKCETWGFSLMDLGVGSFVFSLGVVSAASHLRAHQQKQVRSLLQELRRDLVKSLPLLALGLVRVIVVKMTSYPEHVSEYGVHWSFFLTLASLPILKTFVEAARSRLGGRLSTWGLCIATLHQLSLILGLQAFVLTEHDRASSLLVANREGVASLPGYLSILLLSMDLGMYILPQTDPYEAFRKVKLPQRSVVEESSDSEDREGNDSRASSTHSGPPTGHLRRDSDGRIDWKASSAQTHRQQKKRLSSLVAILISWLIVYLALFYPSAWSFSTFTALQGGFELRTGPSIGHSRLEASSQIAPSHGANWMTLTISRRLANLPYVLVIMILNIGLLAGLLAVYFGLLLDVQYGFAGSNASALAAGASRGRSNGHVSSNDRGSSGLEVSPHNSSSSSPSGALHDLPYSNGDARVSVTKAQSENPLPTTPRYLALVNSHSLPLFLVANVLTGLVNLSIPTMHVSNSIVALAILLAYLAAVSAVGVWLDHGERSQYLRSLLRGSRQR